VKRANIIGLSLSSIYLGWSLGAKVYIDHKIEQAILLNNIEASQFVSTPAPFTTFLWRAIVMSDDRYYEVYASVFDAPNEVSFTPNASYPQLLSGIDNEWGVQRLQWFTKGFYAISTQDDKVLLSDLRMGVECAYVFNFVVGNLSKVASSAPGKSESAGSESAESVAPVVLGNFEKVSQRPDFSAMGDIFARITDPTISLAPSKKDGECE
jgi:inner membrane protein